MLRFIGGPLREMASRKSAQAWRSAYILRLIYSLWRHASRVSFGATSGGPLVLTFATILAYAIPARGDRAQDLANQAENSKREVCDSVSDYKACHERYPAGCGKTTKSPYDPYLNFLKNQTPDSSMRAAKILTELENFQKGLDEKTPKGLKKSNHAEHVSVLAGLGEGNIYGLIGYLYAVKREHRETTNCNLDDGVNTDFHMWVGFDPDDARKLRQGWKPTPKHGLALKQEAVIVEMTPHYRSEFQRKWTLPRVQRQIGRQVKVIGQLMNDNEHLIPTQNCAHPDADEDQCWRGSGWELHPVIEMYVCPPARTPCSEDSADWKMLGDMQ